MMLASGFSEYSVKQHRRHPRGTASFNSASGCPEDSCLKNRQYASRSSAPNTTSDAEGDPDHARAVARYVDRKMRDVANYISLRSVAKIAVVAAVNLAHELLKEEEASRKMGKDPDRTDL